MLHLVSELCFQNDFMGSMGSEFIVFRLQDNFEL